MKTISDKDVFNSNALYAFSIITTIMKNPNSTSASVIKITKIPQASVYRIMRGLKAKKIIYESTRKSKRKRNAIGPNSVEYSTNYTMIKVEITKNGTTVHVK